MLETPRNSLHGDRFHSSTTLCSKFRQTLQSEVRKKKCVVDFAEIATTWQSQGQTQIQVWTQQAWALC